MRNTWRWLILALVLVLAILTVAGCGNVTLKGDAMISAETSTLDAFNASQRGAADPNIPHWTQVYLDENFKQWRCFVWSAKKDVTWGPKLPSEKSDTTGTKAGG
jgi:hypothetical protein